MTTRSTASRRPASTRRKVDANSVDSAHRAIVSGDKSLGEISDLVQVLESGSDRFSRLADIPDSPTPLKVGHKEDGIWSQKLFGLGIKAVLCCACGLGVASGVPIGFALYGTDFHAAVVGLLSSLT